MLERDITRAIMDYLLLKGAWVFKVHGHLGQRKGIPDILFILDGRGGGIEVKRPGKQPTPYQQTELDAIARAGGWAIVAHDVDDVIKEVT